MCFDEMPVLAFRFVAKRAASPDKFTGLIFLHRIRQTLADFYADALQMERFTRQLRATRPVCLKQRPRLFAARSVI